MKNPSAKTETIREFYERYGKAQQVFNSLKESVKRQDQDRYEEIKAVHGENLIEAMLHGKRRVPAARPVKPASGGSLPALLVALAFAGATVWAAGGSWIPAPPPPPVQSTPAW